MNPELFSFDDYLQLIQQINEHDHLYYVLNQPKISDYEYDKLLLTLQSIESLHKDWVVPYSPSLRVGATPQSEFAKIQRKKPMLSLDNTYSKQELSEFHQRIIKLLKELDFNQMPTYVVEPKIDGISIELTYQDGLFLLATTRGDGTIGEDVTANVKTLRTLPLKLSSPVSLTVRGEIYIEKQAFLKLNEEKELIGEEPFKNPRNAAGGTLKQLDPKIVSLRPLKLLVYEGIDLPLLSSQHELLIYLNKLGFPVYMDFALASSLEELLVLIDKTEKMREKLPFEIDGVVIKTDSLPMQKAIGFTSRSPRFSVAYKFTPQRATTQLKKIDFQVGRTGVITPVAKLTPVSLSGTTVSSASLHNFDQIRRLDIHIEDFVEIEKSGEIIPQIISVIKEKRVHSQPIHPPSACPSCQSALVQTTGLVALKCPNEHKCPAQIIEKIVFFCNRDNMNIENMGPKLVTQLVEYGLVQDLADIYQLTVEQLAQLPRMGNKSAHNVYSAIQKSKHASLTQFIAGLGIPSIGWVYAQTVAQTFGQLEQLLSTPYEKISHTLSAIYGFGEKRAQAIVEYLNSPIHQTVLQKIQHLGVRPSVSAQSSTTGPFSGCSVCVTGTFSVPRQELKQKIEQAGGKFVSAVTSKTHFLLVGNDPGKEKISAALKYKTPQLSEQQWNEKINSSN